MTDERFHQTQRDVMQLVLSHSEIAPNIEKDLTELVAILRNEISAATQSQMHERKALESRTSGFQFKETDAYKQLQRRGFDNLKFSQLRAMATVMASHCNLEIDRQARRRKNICLKWLYEHWDVLEPELARMEMEFNSDDDNATSP
jgi:hypothetical protein